MQTDVSTSERSHVEAPSQPSHEITLSQEDFDTLLLALGMATGLCFRGGQERMAYGVIQLTNRINVGNPHFRPYEIPPKYAATQLPRSGNDDTATGSKGGV